MRKAWSLLLFSLVCLPLVANAADTMGIMRGGLGFVFPDNNSFDNASAFASSMGAAVQAGYYRQNGEGGNSQEVRPSVVYGNGRFGLGAFADRSTFQGGSLTASGQYVDTVGAGLGVGLIRDHLNWGVSYDRQITSGQPNQGVVGTQLSLMGGKGMGPAIAIGATSTVSQSSGNLTTGTAGVGYSFKHNTSVEGNITFNNLNYNRNDYTLGAFVNVASQIVYLSAGYRWLNIMNQHEVLGRLGFMLGHSVDISGYVAQAFASGNDPAYGLALRVML